MFGWDRSAQRVKTVESIVDALPERLESVSSVERATVLVLTNCFIRMLAEIYDGNISIDPSTADQSAVSKAIDEIFPAMEQLTLLVNAQGTPRKKHVECHRLAMALTLCSIFVAQRPDFKPKLKKAWKVVWLSKANAPRAIGWIRDYEEFVGVEAVPRLGTLQEQPTDEDLLDSTSVPIFLRKKT